VSSVIVFAAALCVLFSAFAATVLDYAGKSLGRSARRLLFLLNDFAVDHALLDASHRRRSYIMSSMISLRIERRSCDPVRWTIAIELLC
jgi:hypothetical protein